MTDANQIELLKRIQAACSEGPINYADYIQIALYSEDIGYYARKRERVGRDAQRDFYTAESLGAVFAQLVATAAEDLLPAGRAGQSTFIEIAAEPAQALLDNLPTHPFAASRVIRQGEAIQASGPVVLFANEWLDALPFHRLIFKDGVWRERGVRVSSTGKLEEVLLPQLTAPVMAIRQRLPAAAEANYELDIPLAAEAALAQLLAQDWTGLLLFFDYGKTWASLTTDCAAGTARTYKRHTQENDLLDEPGEKDITCDVCWDPLKAQMEAVCCQIVTLESQESFLVQRAQRAAEAIVCESAGSFSTQRQTLMELIHPAHMGRRFQVLWGIRGA
ncbi:MAG: SAM-dependent MidA family methyltransferase [Lentimonas sp.]|jgi:SAM-dependent MidA family methyltransferase